MNLVEGWEYNRLMSLYKKELKYIDSDTVLDDEEKEYQKAIIAKQIKNLEIMMKKKVKNEIR